MIIPGAPVPPPLPPADAPTPASSSISGGMVALALAVAVLLVSGFTAAVYYGSEIQAWLNKHGSTESAWNTPAGEELIRANHLHFLIASTISQCFPGVDLAWGRDGPPSNVSIPLILGLQPSGEIQWQSTKSVGKTATIKLTNYQRTVLALSNGTTLLRMQLASTAADTKFTRNLLQTLIVAVSALTTILVTMKSIIDTAASSRTRTMLGIFAIIVAAAGTALASLNTAVTPGESFAKAQHALTQARQVQLDLNLLVASDKRICKEFDPDKANDPLAKKMAELSNKVKEIVASSETTGTTSGGGSQTGQSSPSHP
ncbi:hypothetical protein I3J27_26495 [Bradyrhizobium xenonodulans]|uniref:Uncharacterized protein n=1 Tax=Bradyrhizobium xenonodulans TaxID=2736875 RepID=A0ABY7MED0_9BRAD|nr:hypothetical protein [Bradyrhizobium xenonodulans]WBL76559.1 hypothetical protein I3J27_26495 [Bradyrhizobium xenonodulans]